MISIRKFIVYSTVLMLFSDRFYITIGANIFAFYFLVLLNLFFLWRVGALWFPRGLLIFLGYIFLSGVVGLVRGTDSMIGFCKDFFGIVPNVIYACAFYRFIEFDTKQFFAIYARFAFYIALLGFAIYPLIDAHGGRFTSFLGEPASFCMLCIPALYYYADQWQRERKFGWRFIVILVACGLTFSSLGYLGILFGLYLFGTRFRFGTIFMPALVLLVAFGIYTQSKYFERRLDDTVKSLSSDDLSGINISSYGVVANIFVTEKAFMAHPVIGGGLGSYVVSHDRYINQLIGIDFFQIWGYGQLSRWDASSLLLRVTAEFGLLGLAWMAWFLFTLWPWKSTPQRRAIAMALLCYVFLKMVRSGQYFMPEDMIFLTTYAVNGMLARRERRKTPPLLEPTATKCSIVNRTLPNVEPI